MRDDWLKHKQDLEEFYEPWYSYDIDWNGKKFFLKKSSQETEGYPFEYFTRTVKIVQDFLKKPLTKSSFLDLACMEGMASFALADKGAKSVVGVDGRIGNIERANFVKDTLDFKNIAFSVGDVRNAAFKTNSFDAVLALGILYHLDEAHVFPFIENLYKWSKSVVVIDTHFAYFPKAKFEHYGQDYFGLYAQEPDYATPYDASIGNTQSFWLTRSSLFNMLIQVGFTGIYECKYPRGGKTREMDDRFTVVATKGPVPNISFFQDQNKNAIADFEEKNPLDVLVDAANF